MAGDGFNRQVKRLAGVPVKHIALVALVVQNAALVLLLSHSRTMPLVNGERYYPSTAVFLSEIVKSVFFLSVALYEIATSSQTPEHSTVSQLCNGLSQAVFTGDSWKLAIPAILYTIQNTLQYTAASNLDAATFSITYQLKFLTTALFGLGLMGRTLNLRKCMSLGLLVFGVAFVQLSSVSEQGKILSIQDLRNGVAFHSPRKIWELKADGSEAAGHLSKRSATYEGIDDDFAAANPHLNTTIGIAAAVAACVLSGGAGVYFERILKTRGHPKASVWVRNVQLSFYALWPALFLGVLFLDGEYLAKSGFFTGFNWMTWAVIGLQAVGGIVVAVTLDQADNMAKAAAISMSAAIVTLASVLFMGSAINIFYLVGLAATMLAVYLYRPTPDERTLRPPPINVSQYEKSGEPGYFDFESVESLSRSPIRDPTRQGLTTNRPTTPGVEIRRSKSTDRMLAKREQ